MNLHLHHAVVCATAATNEISAISFYNVECRSRELAKDALARAKRQLAEAGWRLIEYETEIAVAAAVKKVAS